MSSDEVVIEYLFKRTDSHLLRHCGLFKEDRLPLLKTITNKFLELKDQLGLTRLILAFQTRDLGRSVTQFLGESYPDLTVVRLSARDELCGLGCKFSDVNSFDDKHVADEHMRAVKLKAASNIIDLKEANYEDKNSDGQILCYYLGTLQAAREADVVVCTYPCIFDDKFGTRTKFHEPLGTHAAIFIFESNETYGVKTLVNNFDKAWWAFQPVVFHILGNNFANPDTVPEARKQCLIVDEWHSLK